jgi:hypothetical protein
MSTHISVPPQLLLERASHARNRAGDRARGGVGGAAARPWQREGGRPGRGRCDAPRTQQAADRRHRGDRRGRARRGADAVHRREGRHQRRPARSISRSIRSKARRCAPRTCRARSRPWRWPTAARCCMRPTSTCRRSRSVPATPKGVVDLDARRRPTTFAGWPRPRASSLRDHGAGAGSSAPCRHHQRACASTGAAVRLITDGDVAGVIHCADPDNTGIDMYIGTGGAPEGVLAAAALRCIGGQMQCRLILDTEEKRERARKMGVKDPAQDLRHRGHGEGRLPVRRHRRHRRVRCCRASSSART